VSRPGPAAGSRAPQVRPAPVASWAEVERDLADPGRRVTPPCAHFGVCGGCDLQHLDDAHQLRYKVEAVRETLLRLGGLEMPSQVEVIPGAPWAYRSRTQLHADTTERGLEVGYFERHSHDLVAVDQCPILVPELEELLPGLPGLLRDASRRRLDLAAGDGGAVTAAPPVEGLPHGTVTTRVGDFDLAFDARCFFQGHRQLLATLVEKAVGDGEGEEAVDLYAGVGLFSLSLARRYRRVIAVESDTLAARFARNNARLNRIVNVAVESVAAEAWVARRDDKAPPPDRVILDPPRAGVSTRVRSWLFKRRIPHLTYVSCHPAALARDLRRIRQAYRLDRVALLDLFPQTGHMEVVAHLSAREWPSADAAPETGE